MIYKGWVFHHTRTLMVDMELLSETSVYWNHRVGLSHWYYRIQSV